MPGGTIGATTDESSLSEQITRYKPRVFGGPNHPKTPGGGDQENQASLSVVRGLADERLTEKCVRVVVDHFAEFPVHERLPAKYLREISERLPSDLDPLIAAEFVFDEFYWKKRCTAALAPRECQIADHGLTWKQLFFEAHLQSLLEAQEPPSAASGTDQTSRLLLEAVRGAQDSVFTLKATQLLAHPDLDAVCGALPNLTRLQISYGVRKIGMKYDRLLFGMKISDANSLAKCIVHAPNLTTLCLPSNLIDDDLLRMLMTGLIKNTQITHLDLAHNKITNHGTRLLAKVIASANSVLTALNLADNQIHAEGGRYLGRALRGNEALVSLNLRLNRLVDDGGQMLLDGFRASTSVTELNLSGNSIGTEAAAALALALEADVVPFRTVDLSCNDLDDKDAERLEEALRTNSTLTSLDLRMNSCSADLGALDSIKALTARNEKKK